MNKQIPLLSVIVLGLLACTMTDNTTPPEDTPIEPPIVPETQESPEEPTIVEPVAAPSIDEITTEQLDMYGETLADWANTNHVTLVINSLPINYEGPNAGGPSTVYWKRPLLNEKEKYIRMGRQVEIEIYEQKLEAMRSNLKELIEKGSCDIDTLDTSIKTLSNDENQDTFSMQFACLGTIEFIPVTFGSE